MKRALLAVVVAGCGPSERVPAPLPVIAPVVAVDFVPEPVAVKPAQPPPEPFAFPKDVGGVAVAKALAPMAPATPVAPAPRAPKPRESGIDRGELPLAPVALKAVALPWVNRKGALPSSPPERVPTELGAGNMLPTSAATMPVVPPGAYRMPTVTPTAADVPKLAQPVPERASLEDPTAEISAARIVNTPLPAPNLSTPFLRPSVPDPFEWAEQVKPPPSPEMGTAPVSPTR